ncbi:NFX1-type zinc finger-containing protein 1 [Phytophthora nicotianae]|uniref:NFX1-type zinc finger-containing protein 1 n=1 Tax=Phytophthora nicotianae TaxID=4792 RepID=A0A0W8DFS4_PHYNI|nr:NFX1-type zinc finger-containing protein 1 [Phytophthora nicotianae]
MRYGAAVQPLRVNTRLAPEGQFNGLQPRTEYTRDLPPLQERRQVATYHAVSRQREHFEDDHEWQDVEYDAESEEDGEQENADPSTESSGNSREAQHWSDTSSARTGELDDESQGEVSCRVSWCEQPGKRYGLCWAHGGEKEKAESDKEECDCCCVGKESCTCSCTCKCHVESDEEDEEMDKAEPDEETKTPDEFPVMPSDPFATRFAKLNKEVDVTLEDVKKEVENFLQTQSSDSQPQTAKDVLRTLSSLEKHLISKFTAKSNAISWAGRRSVLELLPELLDDSDDDEASAGKWLLNLLQSSETSGNCVESSHSMSEKLDDVLPFIRQCRATVSSSSSLSSLSSDKQQQWIARRLAVELGRVYEDSGLPSVEEMLKVADNGEEASVVKYVGSLDLNRDDSSIEDTVIRMKNPVSLVRQRKIQLALVMQ